MCACKRGHVDCVRLLLSSPTVSIDCVNQNGLTAEEITKNPLIKDMIRKEHWKRVKDQVKEIQKTVGVDVGNIRKMNNTVEDDYLLKNAILAKNKELLKKIDLIESKEAKEYENLELKIQAETRAIKEKYCSESMEFRKEVCGEIGELKNLLDELKRDSTDELNLKTNAKSVTCWTELVCTRCSEEMLPPTRLA